MYANNPDYVLAYQFGKHHFYQPGNTATGYHHSRYVEAYHNEIYANGGATAEVLNTVMEEMVLLCNSELNLKTLRTDIAALANSVLYRLKYPIDQHCAARQGALLLLLEYTTEDGTVISEPHDKVDYTWTDRKMKLANEVPDVYSFFLTLGIASLPRYNDLWTTLESEDYFPNRDQAIQSMMPQRPGAG